MDNPTLKKIHFGSFLLLAFFPLLNAKMVPLAIASWLLTNIVFGFIEQNKNGWNSLKPLFVQSSLFIIILIWTLIIDQSKDAYFYLERSLSLLIFPIGFYFNPITFNHKQLNIIKISFAGSSIFFILISSIIAFFTLIQKIGNPDWYPTLNDLLSAHNFHHHFRSSFENFSDFHPTYASMYLGLSFIFILNLLINHFSEISLNRKILGSFSLLLILILIAILASRTPFIATILVSILLLFIKLKRKIYAFFAIIAAILIATALFFTVPSFSARFSEISLTNTALPSEEGDGDSFNVRTGILHCTIELISNNWLTGVGPGQTQKLLDKCYMDIAPEIYKDEHYNTHNQFLSYWVGMGVLGILTLIFILFSTSYVGLKNHNLLPLIVCLFFSLCFMTENILVRQQGVVVVAFFLNLFYFTEYRTKSVK
ncbi:O-antigen ligase family protein [Vicingus serpentipes]|uniref:O-antigen ligase family protein n=1 Tax=Vicingus serpentipes TaxID=1926625 RepID=A0A5C6RVP6_9FLAO|nr:O-antigen ligase family protein [Vicingus serpentipes]TXB65422.1 O-antigen ligase family protein [Vicingus serpentipes]